MTTDGQDNIPCLTVSLSFGRSTVSIGLLDAAAMDDVSDNSSEDFEFALVGTDQEAVLSVSADEIFSGGRNIRSYPLFDQGLLLLPPSDDEASDAAADESDTADQIPIRQLLIEDVEAPAESSPEDPEAAREYRQWSPDRCKKSASTGSSKRWRLRDLLLGRSHSDGKEKFVFLHPVMPQTEKTEKSGTRARKAAPGKRANKSVRTKEMDMVTDHRLHYGKGARASEPGAKGPRRSYLPYRQQLFGSFAPVSNLHRSHHPF